jgi:SpoU rRNA methylase family enzyme
MYAFLAIRDGEIEHLSVHTTENAAKHAGLRYAISEAPECAGFDDLEQAIDVLQGDPALYVEALPEPEQEHTR